MIEAIESFFLGLIKPQPFLLISENTINTEDIKICFFPPSVLLSCLNMTQPRETGPGGEQRAAWSARSEPAVALARLTPRQEELAAMMRDNPQRAFNLLKERIDAMPADPQNSRIKTTRIGETPVEIDVDLNFRRASIIMPIDAIHLAEFMESCEEEGLRQDFMDDLNEGLLGAYCRLDVEFFADAGYVHASALGLERDRWTVFKQKRVSSKVAAVLLDLLEPRGIGPDIEEGGKPAVAGGEEAVLAELIDEDPEEAWSRIENRLELQDLRKGYNAQALIGNTVVSLDKYENELVLGLSIDDDTLPNFREACGGDGLSRDFEADLDRGISGRNVLQIEAKLVGSHLMLEAISYMGYVCKSYEVSPKFFAALIMRLKPQSAGSAVREDAGQEEVGRRAVQAQPSAEPAVADGSPVRNEADRRNRVEFPIQAEPSLAYKGNRDRGDGRASHGSSQPTLTKREQRELERRREGANRVTGVEIVLNKLREQGSTAGGTVVYEATQVQQHGPKSKFERKAGQKKKKEAAKKSKGKKKK